jgi:hypothetical protein
MRGDGTVFGGDVAAGGTLSASLIQGKRALKSLARRTAAPYIDRTASGHLLAEFRCRPAVPTAKAG